MINSQMLELNPEHGANGSLWFWEMVQNSEDWDYIRGGMMTASGASELLVKGKNEHELGVGALGILDRIIQERMTGKPRGSWGSSKGTDFGHENEPDSLVIYSRRNFVEVRQPGFVALNNWIGCSPDGVMDEGMLQSKSFPTKHMSIVRALKKEQETGLHKDQKSVEAQMQFEMWVTGKEWSDAVFYNPVFDEPLDQVSYRVFKDQSMHDIFQRKTNLIKKLAIEELNGFGYAENFDGNFIRVE